MGRINILTPSCTMDIVEKGRAVLATLAAIPDFYARLDCLASLGPRDLTKLDKLFMATDLSGSELMQLFADFRAQAEPLMAAIALKRAVESIGYDCAITFRATSRL